MALPDSVVRRISRLTHVSLIALAGVSSVLAGQAKPPTTHPQVSELARSVVTIEVDLLNGSAIGSGVIVDPSGVIATAAHVIAGAKAARVRFGTGDVMKVEGLIDADPDLDFALIRVAGFQLPTASLGNSDSLTLGERLLAIGTPIGLEATVTDGLLSAIRNDGNRKLLHISIPVSHGSSGGPVFDERGEVVGLVVSGFRADVAENVNFALPINYVRGKLALAPTKTPIPLAQAVIPIPAAPSLSGQPGAAGSVGPEVVNDNLHLDWRTLNGIELFGVTKGQNGAREEILTRYEVTTDPFGKPELIRHLNIRYREKVTLLRSADVAADAVVTEVSLGDVSRLHEQTQRVSYSAAVRGGTSDLIIEGRQFTYAPLSGQSQTGTVPQGTLSPQLINGSIAALPDSSPITRFVWAFDPTTGRAEAARVELGRRDTLKVPLLAGGSSCGADVETRDTSVSAIWVTVTFGTNSYQFPISTARPHVSIDPESVKCLRRPGWGGVP